MYKVEKITRGLMSSYSHSTGTFIGKGGTEIFFQSWGVENPKGILVICHGVGEHSGRYDNIINQLKGSRTTIYALDHRGHGKSGGKRGHVDSFMDYVYDVKLFIDLIREENSNIPLILLGHSMGGVIACKYALTYAEDINALVLSSPGLVASVEVPGWKKSMGKVFSRYAPGFTMATGLDAKLLSHDADVVEAYENDRLVHDKVSARWYTEFVASGQECIVRAPELRMPLLVFHGKNDKIVDYRGSEALFKSSSSTQKELHLFDGLYHETMNEKQKSKVLKIAVQWILKTFAQKKSTKHPKKRLKKPTKESVAKAAHISHKKAPPKKGAKNLNKRSTNRGNKKKR